MPLRLATLVAGVVLVAFAMFAAQRVLADSVEPSILGSKNGSLVSCTSEVIVVSAPANESPCQIHVREEGEARAYLVATSSPGYTMTRQGPERAIGRLHPAFVNRLAAAIAEARKPACHSPEFSRPTGRLHSASAALSTSFTRCTPMGLPSTLPGSVHPARQALCFGTRSRRGTVWSVPTGRTTQWNGTTASRRE